MTLLRETRDGAVAILEITNPTNRNALSAGVRDALIEALVRIESDDEVRATVIAGSDGTFCSGGDIRGMDIRDVRSARERLGPAHELVRRITGSAKPVVAAVEGWAAGAGFSLAAACDLIVAAEDARFVASFVRVGLVADLDLAHTLPLRVGGGHARRILLSAEPVGAAEAERIGLVARLVPRGSAFAAAIVSAARIAAGAPLAIDGAVAHPNAGRGAPHRPARGEPRGGTAPATRG